jgi:hypothetical protein
VEAWVRVGIDDAVAAPGSGDGAGPRAVDVATPGDRDPIHADLAGIRSRRAILVL